MRIGNPDRRQRLESLRFGGFLVRVGVRPNSALLPVIFYTFAATASAADISEWRHTHPDAHLEIGSDGTFLCHGVAAISASKDLSEALAFVNEIAGALGVDTPDVRENWRTDLASRNLTVIALQQWVGGSP